MFEIPRARVLTSASIPSFLYYPISESKSVSFFCGNTRMSQYFHCFCFPLYCFLVSEETIAFIPSSIFLLIFPAQQPPEPHTHFLSLCKRSFLPSILPSLVSLPLTSLPFTPPGSDSPASEATSTTRPWERLSSGRKVLVTRMGPKELTSYTRLYSVTGHHSISVNDAMPALLTTAHNTVRGERQRERVGIVTAGEGVANAIRREREREKLQVLSQQG